MVYSNKLVTVIKHSGNIIREDVDVVKLPFGSEYSILLKNLSTQDCVVDVNVDGQDVLSGSRIVIRANTEHELLGFMNNSVITNKFKFIQKTDQIVNHRGDRIDDGIINISFQYVKQPDYTITWGGTFISPYDSTGAPIKYRSDWYCNTTSVPLSVCNISNNNSVFTCDSSQTRGIQQDEGITVKGSQTHQQYQNAYVGNLEDTKHNIIIRLKGYAEDKKEIVAPVYTNTKLQCFTCGKKSKSNMKFCPDCGTSLI
jgi:hypothetical protein